MFCRIYKDPDHPQDFVDHEKKIFLKKIRYGRCILLALWVEIYIKVC